MNFSARNWKGIKAPLEMLTRTVHALVELERFANITFSLFLTIGHFHLSTPLFCTYSIYNNSMVLPAIQIKGIIIREDHTKISIKQSLYNPIMFIRPDLYDVFLPVQGINVLLTH